MKKLLLLLAVISPIAFAQKQNPIAPMLETNYSNGVKDRLTGDPLPKGNWAFDIRIENPNNEPIACFNTKFWAYIDSYGKGCRSGSSEGIWIELTNKGDSFFSLNANEVNTSLKEYGYKERVDRANNDITKYEYCGREPFTFDCGYYCDKDHKYNDTWKISNDNGGYKEFYCKKNGETILKEVYCTSVYKANDVWKEPIENGNLVHTCMSNGEILTAYECNQSPYHVEEDGKCIPAKCGTTPSGNRLVVELIPFGKRTALCSYGISIEMRTECNDDALADGNNGCREARMCPGNVKHGLSTTSVWPSACPSNCLQTVTTYKCFDGTLENKGSREKICRRSGGCL